MCVCVLLLLGRRADCCYAYGTGSDHTPEYLTIHLVELKRLMVMVNSRPRYPTAAARVANTVTPLRRDVGHTACRNDNHSYLGCTYEIFHSVQTASHPGRCERRQRANVAQSCNTPNVVERGCREVKQKQTRIGGAASPSLFCLSDLDCQLALQQVSKEYHPRVGVSFPAGALIF